MTTLVFKLTDWSGPSPPSTLKPNPDSCFRRNTSKSLVFGAKENQKTINTNKYTQYALYF